MASRVQRRVAMNNETSRSLVMRAMCVALLALAMTTNTGCRGGGGSRLGGGLGSSGGGLSGGGGGLFSGGGLSGGSGLLSGGGGSGLLPRNSGGGGLLSGGGDLGASGGGLSGSRGTGLLGASGGGPLIPDPRTGQIINPDGPLIPDPRTGKIINGDGPLLGSLGSGGIGAEPPATRPTLLSGGTKTIGGGYLGGIGETNSLFGGADCSLTGG